MLYSKYWLPVLASFVVIMTSMNFYGIFSIVRETLKMQNLTWMNLSARKSTYHLQWSMNMEYLIFHIKEDFVLKVCN